jgi:hypothetical protein
MGAGLPAPGGTDRAGPTSPRRGGVYVGESRRGERSVRPAASTAPAYRGADDDHPIAPTVAPQNRSARR